MLSRDNARKETRADKQAVEAASIVLAEEVSRLEQADMPDAAGRILVCKLKGGAGATTTCRELAVAAVAAGLQVALVDPGARAVSRAGGAAGRRTKGLTA
jgi:Mrp family chromosome partitioning ATPase